MKFTKTKKYLFGGVAGLVMACGVSLAVYLMALGACEVCWFFADPINQWQITEITAVKAETIKIYAYNEQIPAGVVRQEIVKQAKAFGNDVDFMLALADCESTFNNLADNPTSTAKGVFQFVALTWEATESNEKHISEFDYIANIREANIKIANQEYSHWADCL